ncbi:UDP-glucose 4-epimerase [Kitasatospora sp. MAA19]|uniref:NAD-dependent epimerase/dehydratase family protein n=1 Tax=unclassified Kitasatospora TaxID=2633591 RepID=UPI0024760965|nr:NAD-dependent epimerase/dehydratase family protein [Kitasatospora sp. MAA19]MDH6709079.1 UDP-glucose 4-epimerase [Kitasatospora sp. MAA19]
MTHIAIVGAGFLGSALGRGAVHRGCEVTVVGHSDPFSLSDGEFTSSGNRLIIGSGADHIPGIIENGVDVIFVAAGGRFPVPSSIEPSADAIGTLSLLIPICEAVRSSPTATRIVFLSSAGAVYSPGAVPKKESDLGEPTSPYGMSRLTGEHYLSYYRRVHGLRTHSLRCANIYGRLLPSSRGQGVISAAFRSALTGEPFRLYGDGRQIRDFIHVDDFVQAALDLVCDGIEPPEVINVGSGVGYSISQVLERVSVAMKSEIPVVTGPTSNTDVGRLVTDVSLLRTLVAFEPRPPDVGIDLMADTIARSGPAGRRWESSAADPAL